MAHANCNSMVFFTVFPGDFNDRTTHTVHVARWPAQVGQVEVGWYFLGECGSWGAKKVVTNRWGDVILVGT